MKKITLLILSFLANITASFGQFSEGFESGIPATWTIRNSGDASTWTGINLAFSIGFPARGGNKIAAIYNGGTDDYLITPAITVAAGVNDQIYFWGRSRYSSSPDAKIDVLLSTTGTAAADFTVTLQAGVTPPSGPSWYKYSYNLTAYAGQTVYIAFRTNNILNAQFEIDDVVSRPIASCNEPTALSVPVFSNTSATITWTAPAAAPANGYDYYVSQSSTAPTAVTVPTGSTAAGVTTATVSVAAGTIYYVWVRSKCAAADSSIWSASVTFTSACNSNVESYTQNFNAAPFGDSFLPQCTSVINVGTGGDWVLLAAAFPFSTQVLAYTPSNNNVNCWFFTNGVTLTAGTSYTIAYKYGKQSGPATAEKFKVAYGTSPTVAAMATILADHPAIANGVISNGSVAFTPATSGTYYFGFNAYSAGNNWLYLDDISIAATPLSTDSFNLASFRAYPNPVKDILNFSYSGDISKAEIFNLLGQQVTAKQLNANHGQIDVSNLTSGTYMVKVTVNNETKTIKVIKE